jgi:RNA-directed DNA polymerase
MGLRLSETKTKIVHIDEGFDFLGFRIQRQQKRGTTRRYVYTYPSKAALAAVKAKVRALSQEGRNLSLEVLLHRLNPMLRGWTNYFRYGVPKATFAYLSAFAWHRVVRWLSRKHYRRNWKWIRGRYLQGSWPRAGGVALFKPTQVDSIRYCYRRNTYSPWVATPNGVR